MKGTGLILGVVLLILINPIPPALCDMQWQNYDEILEIFDPISEASIVKASHAFLKFTLEWQISYCKTNPCTRTANQTFSIHGLWPTDRFGEPVVNCTPCEKFNKQEIEKLDSTTLKGGLTKQWPTLSGEHWEFWRYQWEKHGCCSDFEIKAYFTAAYNLAVKYDVTKYLKDGGITPTKDQDTKTYTLASVEKAINDGASKAGQSLVKNSFKIQCKEFKGKYLLTQIIFCVEKDAEKLYSCPAEMKSCTANADLVFPATATTSTLRYKAQM